MDETLIQKIAELTNAVKENGGLNGLKKEELIADFQKMLDEQRRQILEETPARAGEAAEFSDPVQRAVNGLKGRYARHAKAIVKDGFYRDGGQKVKAVDLWMAKALIDKAYAEKLTQKPASEDLAETVKAMTSTGSGTGDELVPTGMAAELWADFFTASRIANDLPNQPMPTDPFDLPLGLGARTWRKGSQGLASSAADVATAKVTLTSTEQITEDNWTYDLDEDAVIAMMPALRADIAMSGGEQMDAFVLNADATATATGNINSDDGAPASDSYYLSAGQDGIRHLPLVDATGQGSSAGAAVSDTVMAAGLLKIGKYGIDLQNCRIVPDVTTYLNMLSMTNVATIDKYGPQATIVNGELARYRGIPVIPSASMPKTEADGKVSTTAGNNTKGQIAIYNRNFWRVGYRRGLTIEVDRLIQRRLLVMVSSFRIAVAAHGTRSAATHTAVIYNIG